MPLISKLPDVGTTIFTVMSKLAADHQAVNLSQGFPDFDPRTGAGECCNFVHAQRPQPVRSHARGIKTAAATGG